MFKLLAELKRIHTFVPKNEGEIDIVRLLQPSDGFDDVVRLLVSLGTLFRVNWEWVVQEFDTRSSSHREPQQSLEWKGE